MPLRFASRRGPPRAGTLRNPMPAKCPICETVNSDDVDECANCGKILATAADLMEDVEPIDGLEQTIHDPLESATGPIAVIAELEETMIARKDLEVPEEHVQDVELTQIKEDPAAPINWTPGPVEIDLGRELDDGVRTPAPQDTGACPWCNAPATGAVCDNCGPRKSRYSVQPAPSHQQAGALGVT